MTQDPAWRIIQSAFRCSAELQDLLQFLKEHGSSGEYERYRLAIAAAIDTINVQLTGKVLSARPELEHRIETELNTSGRIA
jgi:CRISPR/Cas system-associated protein Csm6